MTSNPMSEASKAGLLKRMHADKADTFVKKVKWVSKHIPTITDPQAYVGWLTREERSKMATRNPSPEKHLEYALTLLTEAEDDLTKSKADKTPRRKLLGFLSAYDSACAGLAEAADSGDRMAISRTRAMREKVKKEIVALFDDKAKNPEGATRKITKTGSAREEARFRAERKRLASYRMTPKRTGDHNYVVCDQHGVAIALTTTLTEARKIAPKGGCVEKL
jgi:hypothetical protein